MQTEFLCNVIFVTSFLGPSNFYVIIVTTRDLHKIMKSVTKFWSVIKRTDRSHRCPTDTNKEIDKATPCYLLDKTN